MFEEIFVSDNMILNFFVFIYLYWYLIIGLFIPASYYVFLRIFTFSLITRKAHEFVLIISPESVKIKKITARLTPMFVHKKGLYWFDDPCEDVESLNRYHIYVEGINQNITHNDKHENKLHDLTKELEIPQQVSSHKILLPKDIKKHFNRHFILIVNPETNLVKLEITDKRQPLKVNFYHTLGVYIQKQITEQTEKTEQEVTGSSGTKMVLMQLNTQMVMHQIKYASAYRYYSSYYAFKLHKKIQKMEKMFMVWVKGSIDPKLIMALLVLLIMGGAIFAIFYVFSNPSNLIGPMPTG